MHILFIGPDTLWADYDAHLPRALAEHGITAEIAVNETARPDDVDAIIYAPKDKNTDFSQYPNAHGVFALWAGVDSVVNNETLTQPLARLVDPSLSAGIREWVTGYILHDHLNIRVFENANGAWRDDALPPLARDKTVAILGLGALGQATATALLALGFHVTGWSRHEKSIAGVKSYHGADGLALALKDADYIVLLLPHTKATENFFNDATIALCKKEALLLNAGRGALVDDDALLAALDRGALRGAVLDVFKTEPLPADHRYWAHERVLVTPHIAGGTRAETAAYIVAANIKRMVDGLPLEHLVDRQLGY